MGLTIKDIARMAGVSVSSVSRVINNSKPVNDEIREKVQKLIDETNFRPNALARGLINKTTNLIGVIIPQINAISAGLIDGIEEIANKNGYNIILSSSRLDIKRELKALSIFKEKQVEGIIISSVDITDEHIKIIENNELPLVVVGQKTTNYNLPWVDVDNYHSVAETVRFLIQLGHQHIGMIHGPLNDHSAGYERYKGFLDEMESQNLACESRFLIESEFNIESGYKAMEKLFRNEKVPTAIVAASDAIAIGAKNCAEERGFFVPEDLSIIGFDDVEMARSIKPALTTVRVNSIEMGSKSMELLNSILKNGKVEALENFVDYRLMIRDSTRDLREKK